MDSMIDIIRASERHFSDFDWLQTYWLFSFSSYYDPHNIQFGALRVFNDDVVQPGKGFPTHPHEEMEIVTIVLDGEMTHEDSMGNKAVIRAGDVQRMSAGTGLTHSEFNRADKPVHFYQIWIFPDTAGLKPSYDQRHFEPDQWQDRLLAVASGQGMEGAVTFHTDATIYRCSLDEGKTVALNDIQGRRIFVYLTDGRLVVHGHVIEKNDQVRIDKDDPLVLKALTPTQFIVVDVPSCKGYGYDTQTLRGARDTS
jgi:redox-sensitive bicupin YhaK (pirin superfamily)